MLDGYQALRETAACLDLSSRGRITAIGRDRVRLLHNLTTNHIRDLRPGQGCYAFLLTAQGRIQADVNILCLEDRFLLDTEPELRERLPALIRRYIIADDVKLHDESEALAEIAVEGPAAGDALARAGAPLPETAYAHAPWDDARVARLSATGQPGFRIFLPAAQKEELIARLGLPAAPADEMRAVRLENGIPRYGDDIFETTLPQESRQLHAIHFNKGCYLGQEIVERIRARGHLNRELVHLAIDGAEPPAPGAKLVSEEGAEAGEITSAAFSPARGGIVALGYARVPHAAPGTRLTVAGMPARVLQG